MKIVIASAFVFLSSLVWAQEKSAESISMEQFRIKLQNDKELIVLDVRTPEEIALGKIKSAITIPVQVLEQRMNELEKYKDQKIFVICRTQNRSAVAASILNKKGFTAIYVVGGMSAFNQK